MRWTVSSTDVMSFAADIVIMPVMQKKDEPDLGPVKAVFGSGIGKLAGSGFKAGAGKLFLLPADSKKPRWILLAGLGDAKDLAPDTLRRAAGHAARRARDMTAGRIAIVATATKVLGFDDETFARCWCEGAEMSLSPVGKLKTGKKPSGSPRSWTILADKDRARALRAGLKNAQAMTAGCLFARELVNMPPNQLTPAVLASYARSMARREGLKCQVLGVAQLKKMKMGGLLGVGQGSVHPPRLIVLDYKGSRSAKAPKIALVGKGVTFDSGGISLKPGAGMDEMKADMAGAAGVLGAALAIARLKLPVNLQVVVPTAENMPDGGAIKPADVLTMANGKTVEVLNTDAEGRLILADGLWYAGRSKPDYLLDMATLTGACVVALGRHFAGIMGNSAELMELLKQAGGETFERVWPLPLVDEHKEIMKGTWGDLQNIGGGREGGAMTAAAFLSAFVDDDTAWTHLDIAGPSYSAKGDAVCPAGGTGFGARLLARMAQILAS